MGYDLLIRGGRIVDGSGMAAFRGDVAVKGGKIVALGRLSGPSDRVIEAEGRVVAPGFIDNHCHYDAQVTWDPLCSFSCDHGATSVVIGNCSLALAPVRPGAERRLAEFLSYVEAIPMEVLETVEFDWQSVPQYMDRLEGRLGVNVGALIGHSAVRYYAMGEDCQKREARAQELEAMRRVVREGMEEGALGLSVSRNRGHYDPQGVPIPALWAGEEEIFALAGVLGDLGTGVIQSGGGRAAEFKNGLMSRLSEASGRTVVYNNLGQTMREPDLWKEHMARVEETARAGVRAYPMCTPDRITQSFTMKNCQIFRGVPSWHPILIASEAEKLRAYSDPQIRQQLHEEVVLHTVEVPAAGYARNWYDYMWVEEPALQKNRTKKGKTIRRIAEEEGKRVIDAFLDLVVEEKLETRFMQAENNVDDEAMAKILTYRNAVVGLSDGGAHVQFHGGYGYSTRLLSEWVREKGVMTLEEAVRRLTFDSASAFGIYDRGLLRPGMAADIVVFDPETVRPLPEEIVHDFPAGGWRMKEGAAGIAATIVNGEVLLEDGKHTGAFPGKVLRNSLYQTRHRA